MALDIATPFAAGAPSTFSTAQPDITGATATGITDVVTGQTNGTLVTAIVVRALTDTERGCVLHIYHLTGGTRRNVGHIVVPPGRQPSSQEGPWEGTWSNAGVTVLSGEKLQIAPESGDTVFTAYPVGGDL